MAEGDRADGPAQRPNIDAVMLKWWAHFQDGTKLEEI
jgi:hypothetical protein